MLEALSPHKLAVVRGIGQTLAVSAGASGRAILAFLDRERQSAILNGIPKHEGNRVSGLLGRALEKTRRREFPARLGGVITGSVAVAAPYLNHLGEVAGSVGLIGPNARVSDDIPHYGSLESKRRHERTFSSDARRPILISCFGDRLVSTLDVMLDTKRPALRRVEVITGPERRRRWPDDEKARVLEETMQPGVVISEVARRNGLTPQQLFTWRRQARRTAVRLAIGDEPAFVSAVVDDRVAAAPTRNEEVAVKPPPVLELEIDGSNVWVWRDAEIGLVTAVVRALKGGR